MVTVIRSLLENNIAFNLCSFWRLINVVIGSIELIKVVGVFKLKYSGLQYNRGKLQWLPQPCLTGNYRAETILSLSVKMQGLFQDKVS